MDMGMSLTDLFMDYRQNEYALQNMNFSHLSEQDLGVISEYTEEKAFINEMSKAVIFTRACTGEVALQDGKTMTMSLIPQDMLVNSVKVLTADGSDYILEQLHKESFTAEYSMDELNDMQKDLSAQIKLFAVEKPEKAETLDRDNVYLVDVAAQLDIINSAMEELEIDPDRVFKDTSEKFSKMAAYYTETKVEDLTVQEDGSVSREKQSEEAEVVESFDGYVLNTSAVTPANEKAINEKITNGNEVVHDEAPQQTTNDKSAVKATVKLETAKDVGTKEKASVDAGFGKDEDIEVLGKTSKTYYDKTDEGIQKASRKKSEEIER